MGHERHWQSERIYNLKIFVGDGMSRKWLEDEVEKAGLSSNFYFEGFKPIEVIPKYTAISNVLIGCLVKSDLLEATVPAKVVSYLASGKPIVLSMDGEVQQLVNDIIKCGFVGATEDSAALAANIARVYHLTPEEQNDLGDRGRAYYFKNFERNLSLQKLYDFIFD